MARKFKIGDTVEAVPGAWDSPKFKAGHRGEVVDYYPGFPHPYRVRRKNGNELSFNARELKLIKHKGE